jgi:tetratricopeptide (TPR) repeat protein
MQYTLGIKQMPKKEAPTVLEKPMTEPTMKVVKVEKEEELTAVEWRKLGREAQLEGRLNDAMKCYLKAIELDPNYACPHNDLGVLYEHMNMLNEAKEEYLLALQIDPSYAKAHYNLALLCERTNDIRKAIYHLKMRIKLGKPGEKWTERAKERLKRLQEQLKEYSEK